jgi:hypothetical protein
MRRRTSTGVAKCIDLNTETICGGVAVREISMLLAVSSKSIIPERIIIKTMMKTTLG